MQKVLLVGGTGEFGRRLLRGLIETTDLDVIVAGRDITRCERIARDFNLGRARTRVSALQYDATRASVDQLRASGAFLVADAAGPYQHANHNLVRAAIAAGMHYIDLADGREFVARFGELDDVARKMGTTALCGCSSTPALSTAVLDQLTPGWQAIETVHVGISPGNRASPCGLSVIRSILSYAGKPVRVFVDGEWTTRMGWGLPQRREMGILRARWLSLCETPDLDILPARYCVQREALFRGGLELAAFHFGLFALGAIAWSRLVGSLEPLAPWVQKAAKAAATLGSDRGGMLVEVTGLNRDGARVYAKWTLIAESGDGPYVPTLPALAAIRALVEKRLNRPGVSACVGMLDLATIADEFRPYRITTQMETRTLDTSPSPFERLLGRSFERLPEPVRYFHSLRHALMTEGRAKVSIAPGFISALVCAVFGLPAAGDDVLVSVFFLPKPNGLEFWRRRFAKRRYQSTMGVFASGTASLLIEHFGPFRLFFKLTPQDDSLEWLLVRWKFLFLPLPRWTLLKVKCRESADGVRFVFDIDFALPIIGPVIHYTGWLLPVQSVGGGRHIS